MDSPGIEVRPIRNLTGDSDFNEVVFDDVFVPEAHLIGEVDGAWKQAASELAYERSGPERFLETIFVLYELARVAGETPDDRMAEGLGRLVAELSTLRNMSVSVAGMLEAGKLPDVEAAVVKEQGTNWEQALPARAPRPCPGRVRRPRQPGRLRGGAALRDPDRAEAHHPGRGRARYSAASSRGGSGFGERAGPGGRGAAPARKRSSR